MTRNKPILGMAVAAVALCAASQLYAAGLQQAVAASKQSGLPMLVIGSSDS